MISKKYDLIIVGTGFASSFFLKKYLEKRKEARVLVLERGRLYSHQDRLASLRGKAPSYQSDLESHESAVINNNPSKPWVFDVNFGGSSNCWWACTPRLMPNDFQLFTKYGKGQDWPISYNELESYYCDAEDIMGISGPEITPFPKSRKYPLPSHILSTVDKKMQSKYGQNWISQPTGRASAAFGNRNACCSSYTCSVCPVDAKFTIENGLKYLFEDPRVELKFGLQAIKLEVENNVAKSVICVATGSTDVSKTEKFEGEVIALGANAIFNAHILLNSGDLNPLTGAGICDQRGYFANMHIDMDNVGGSSALTANGYMEYDGEFRKNGASCLIENHNAPMIRNEKGKWRKLARFKFVFEEIPNNENKIKVGESLLKPVIEYKGHSSYIDDGKKRVLANMNTIFSPLPVEEIFVDDYYQDTEFHVLSSARMGTTKENSVVDKHMIHHQYRNLFVLGGSSFPAVSASNPSLTISALSLKSANENF